MMSAAFSDLTPSTPEFYVLITRKIVEFLTHTPTHTHIPFSEDVIIEWTPGAIISGLNYLHFKISLMVYVSLFICCIKLYKK